MIKPDTSSAGKICWTFPSAKFRAGGNYPGDAHCKLSMIEDASALTEFQSTLHLHSIQINALSCHGNALHPDKVCAQQACETSRKTILLAEKLSVPVVIDLSGYPSDSPQAAAPKIRRCMQPPCRATVSSTPNPIPMSTTTDGFSAPAATVTARNGGRSSPPRSGCSAMTMCFRSRRQPALSRRRIDEGLAVPPRDYDGGAACRCLLGRMTRSYIPRTAKQERSQTGC